MIDLPGPRLSSAQARSFSSSARVLSSAHFQDFVNIAVSLCPLEPKRGTINSLASAKHTASSCKPNSRSPASVSATRYGSPKLPKCHVMLSSVRLYVQPVRGSHSSESGRKLSSVGRKTGVRGVRIVHSTGGQKFADILYRPASSFAKAGQC